MNEYINGRLVKWGEWMVRGGNAGKNGYPGQAAFMRMVPSSEPSSWSPLLDTEAEEVNQCVLRLSPDRKRLVTVYYMRTATADMVARELGCCKKTLFNRLALAHEDIMGMLNDLAAGLKLPDITLPEAA